MVNACAVPHVTAHTPIGIGVIQDLRGYNIPEQSSAQKGLYKGVAVTTGIVRMWAGIERFTKS